MRLGRIDLILWERSTPRSTDFQVLADEARLRSDPLEPWCFRVVYCRLLTPKK
jgi:hypothetical protein